jgi:hypothetical protein
LEPRHFFAGKKNPEFQPKIVCKPSNIDVALIKGRRGSVYRQQQRIPTSRFQGPKKWYNLRTLGPQRTFAKKWWALKVLTVLMAC